MEIDISRVKDQPGTVIELQQEIGCPELLDVKCIGPVQVSLRVLATGSGINVTGKLQVTLELFCIRCLEPFTYQLRGNFDENFYPVGGKEYNQWLKQQKEAGTHPLGLDDNFYSGNFLDISDVIYDSLLTAIPMKPVCKSECLGICPICGGNRNRKMCNCQADNLDPRLEVLQDLLTKRGSS